MPLNNGQDWSLQMVIKKTLLCLIFYEVCSLIYYYIVSYICMFPYLKILAVNIFSHYSALLSASKLKENNQTIFMLFALKMLSFC